MISNDEFAKLLHENCIVEFYETIDSTSDELKRRVTSTPTKNTLLIANHQSAGRGRYNRSFFSPKDTGIYFSILYNDLPYTNFDIFTLLVGQAICNVFKNTYNIQVELKWVNDLFYEKKKVGGILVEANIDFKQKKIEHAILGIGINLSTLPRDFPDELQEIAISLKNHAIDKNNLVINIINQINNDLSMDRNVIIDNYKQYCFILGSKISFTYKNKNRIGTAIDINHNGHLVVLSDQEILTLQSGEISINIKN